MPKKKKDPHWNNFKPAYTRFRSRMLSENKEKKYKVGEAVKKLNMWLNMDTRLKHRIYASDNQVKSMLKQMHKDNKLDMTVKKTKTWIDRKGKKHKSTIYVDSKTGKRRKKIDYNDSIYNFDYDDVDAWGDEEDES